jgi:type IX secretion system substrate protein
MNNYKFLRYKFHYIIITVILFGFSTLKAQEALIGLQINPKVKQLHISKSKDKTAKEKASIELPFIDDFAKSIGFADSSLWQDEYVFVNQTYAYDALSIGVATFDAIDGTGAIHANAESYAFGADTLTSKPINLDYAGDNTIFLSFYYQPGGLGDIPEIKDSLILEFCHNDTVWNKKWNVVFNANDSILTEKHWYGDTTLKTVEGDTLTDLKLNFHRVLIPVNEDIYLKNNFQFRFRNYASLSSSETIESKASNADHWHIDYVVLNKDRSINDTIIEDVVICKPIGSLLKTYEALPWSHLDRAFSYEIQDSIELTYRNLTDQEQNPWRKFEIIDIMNFTGTTPFDAGKEPPISPMAKYTYKRPIDYPFPYDPSYDSSLFEIRGFFHENTLEDISFRWNDTTRFYQKFYNYYAYDDGTAENGYGIIGEGAERAMVAMHFNTYKEDSLRAIQIYFNQVLDNVTNQLPFKIHVWSESNGKPGSILYTQEDLKPQNEDELNKFTTYKLDSAIVLEGNFFIGWQKVNTSEMLNLGFDVNRINNDKLYYNFSGSWTQSELEGTVMIRPVFGKDFTVATATDEVIPQEQTLEYSIYPNPAKDILNVNIDDQFSENYRYTIFDIYGRVFMDKTNQQTTLDISNLNSGIYFIRISNPKGINTTKKFMVVR